MGDNNSTALVVAATILGLCIIAGSYMLGRAIDGTAQQIAGVQVAITKSAGAAGLAAAPTAPTRPRRGPDPAKVYQVNSKGAPAKGPAVAKITVAEFADFQ